MPARLTSRAAPYPRSVTRHLRSHLGLSHSTGRRWYATVTEWIDEHGRQILGPPREHYLNDPHVVGMERARTEIEVPVA